jgi:hypothetical protein
VNAIPSASQTDVRVAILNDIGNETLIQEYYNTLLLNDATVSNTLSAQTGGVTVAPGSIERSCAPGQCESSGSDGLSDGAIAGIVVGSVIGGLLLIFLLAWFCLHSRKSSGTSNYGSKDHGTEMATV